MSIKPTFNKIALKNEEKDYFGSDIQIGAPKLLKSHFMKKNMGTLGSTLKVLPDH